MAIIHAYHIFADGAWQAPATEHLEAIAGIPFEYKLLGVSGSQLRHRELLDHFPGWSVVSESADGSEEGVLTYLHDYAQTHEDKVLYAHGKGAANPTPINEVWRRRMTACVCGQWQRCVELLDSYDAVGPHWLTPEEFPGMGCTPFFGGNFWWANTTFLRQLPPIDLSLGRWGAENWVGGSIPVNAFNLYPGWPDDKDYVPRDL